MVSKVFWAVCLAAAVASAQRGGGGGDDSPRIPVGGSLPGASAEPLTKFDQFAAKLKLNKDQKVEAQSIVDAYTGQAAPLGQRLLKGKQEITAALLGGQSGEALDKVTAGYTDTVEELTTLEATAFAKIVALVKPNQRNKAASAFPLLVDLFEHPQMGGGRHWGGR